MQPMTRHLGLISLTTALILAAATAWPVVHPRPAVAAVDPRDQVSVDVARPELHCDGDGTRVLVRALNADGTPGAGRDVRIVADGTIETAQGAVASGDVAGQTNDRGVFRARITPTPGTTVRWLLRVTVDGLGAPTPGAWYACDFSSDTAYTIAGSVFHDGDADGVRDPHENAVRHARLVITKGYNFGSEVPPHTTTTDAVGGFGWAGLYQDGIIAGRDEWRICLAADPAGHARTIVSINGVPAAPASCASLLLQPGVNQLELGVQ